VSVPKRDATAAAAEMLDATRFFRCFPGCNITNGPQMSLTGSNSNSRGTDTRWLRLQLRLRHIGQRSVSCLTRFAVFSCKCVFIFICSTLVAIISR
ncbi:unnamed protein product, partial [Musa banksii]